jgi:hypothetical protein
MACHFLETVASWTEEYVDVGSNFKMADISVVIVNFASLLSSLGSMTWPETDKVQGAEQQIAKLCIKKYTNNGDSCRAHTM